MPRKKYSINWENDEPVSFEVDAILYESLDQIPGEADRSKLETMMNASVEDEFEKEGAVIAVRKLMPPTE